MEISEFFAQLPNFTKYYIIGTLILAIMTSMKLWNPIHAYIMMPDTVLHFWRYITSACFMGAFGFDLFFEIYFLLEKDYQGARFPDYIYMILFCYIGCLGLSSIWFWGKWFLLSRSFTMAITYIFCKRNPSEQIHLFFVFSVKAAYFPFAQAILSLLMGSSIVYAIIGIIIGHVFIYLKDIYPVARVTRSETLWRRIERNAAGGVPQNNGENIGQQQFRFF